MTNIVDFPQNAANLKSTAAHILSLFTKFDGFADGQEYWTLLAPVPVALYPLGIYQLLSNVSQAAGHAPNTYFMAHTAAYQVFECLAEHEYASELDAMIAIRDIDFTVNTNDALAWLQCEQNRKYAEIGWKSYGADVSSWQDFEYILWAAVVQWFHEIGDAIIQFILGGQQ